MQIMPQSAFLQEATERGFVFQTTDAERLDAALTAGPVAAYIGFDCTADYSMSAAWCRS